MKLEASKHFRIFSDIHLDFDVRSKGKTFDDLWFPDSQIDDLETTLILAGDLWHAGKWYSYENRSWIAEVSKLFKYVIIVLGNHDMWSGNLSKEYQKARQAIVDQGLTNVYLLQNQTLEIGNYKLIGATLWTDFLNRDPLCIMNAKRMMMHDYRYTSVGPDYHALTAFHIYDQHITSRNYIFYKAVKDYPEQKVWVISHHLPTFKSIHPQYHRTDLKMMNALFYSDLDQKIFESEIDVWIHGHTHTHFEYELFPGKKIICNPRGYTGEITGFDPVSIWI